MSTDFKCRALELATCGICLELFTEPKCLPCLHTFCLRCLDSCFAYSTPGTVETCPMCRGSFEVPETWLDGLVNFNLFVRDLLNLWRSSADRSFDTQSNVAATCEMHDESPETVYEVEHSQQHDVDEMCLAAYELRSNIDEELERLLDVVRVARVQLRKLNVTRQNFVAYIKVETTKVAKTCKKLKLTDGETRSLLDKLEQVTSENVEELRCKREGLETTLIEIFIFCAYYSELRAEGKQWDMTRAADIYLQRRATELQRTDVASFQCSPPVVVYQTPTADPRVVHTLPEAETVCGVTSLDDEVFVARLKDAEQIDVYEATSFCLLRRLTVEGLVGSDMENMTSCRHHRCLYISDSTNGFIYRIDLQNRCGVKKWSVDETPCGLSTTRQFSLLVTCRTPRKILEFSTDGEQLRVVDLDPGIDNPWHAIQLSNDQLAVCHGCDASSSLYRVCIVDSDGNVVHSFGGRQGRAAPDMLMWPCHLAVDKDGFVYLADAINRRVLLLSPTLNYIRDFFSTDVFEWEATRLHLDVERGRLYVADDEGDDAGEWLRGRVVVCSCLQDSENY